MRMLSWFFGVMLLAWPAYAQVPSVFIDDLTWPEVRHAIAGGKRTAIIYVGSSEQNGPHMVIGKHDFVARGASDMLAGMSLFD
jgi:creatinine amidohydrolase